MGKRGPPPQPTVLKELHGHPSHAHPKPKGEPKPELAELMPPPAHLGKDAAAVWRHEISVLRAVGLLTKADLGVFAALCSARGDLMQADRALKRGIVIKGSDGVHRRSPWYLVKAKAIEQIKQLSPQFGMTPSGRASLGRAMGEAPHAPTDLSPPIQAGSDTFDTFLADKPKAAPIH